ncbi:MAG: cation:proton antiporter [Alphaproteobacteria bacterium]|nr:cation:proton antiporter [Alphaproteobacteria bacterium]
MSASESFLAALIIIFSVPYLVWRGLKLEAWAPLAIVQIVGGVVLGPGILGALAPGFHQAVFTPGTIGALSGIANWAVMVFVFLAGCELELHDAWAERRDAVTTAALALVTPLLAGILAALVLLQFGAQWAGADGAGWQVVLGTGMACAVTALPILVLLLQKLDILRTGFGQRILRYASLDDLAIWAVLAAILLDGRRLAMQLGFLVVFAAVLPFYRRLVARVPEQDRWALALPWLLLCAFGADYSGLHFMVGAFLAGAVSERRWFDALRFDQFREAVLLVVMPVFFLSTGLKTTWHMGGVTIIAAAALLLAASVLGKLAGVGLAARLLRWPKGDALAIGWLLQTKALIMIIFANVLLDKAIISADLFTALLLMAVASTALTIPAVRPMLRARPVS